MFLKLLPRIRDGVFDGNSINYWKFLLKREVKPNMETPFKDAIRLFPDNATCNNFNNKRLKELNMPICTLIAVNEPPSARSMDEENFYVLKNTINIAINAKITLTTNLWTRYGLVNGANGTIRDIIYPKNSNKKTLPSALLIVFVNYNGPKLFDANDHRHNWIPINPFPAYNKQTNSERTQYPIRLSYALTIHKSQGQTIEEAVIDLGKKEQSLGLTFVALSRLKKFTDFLIMPFTLERLQKISKSKSLPPRLEEEKRMRLIINETIKKFSQ